MGRAFGLLYLSREPLAQARSSAARDLGGQRLDDAGGAGALGRGPQGLGARTAARALPGRDRLLEDDLRRAQRARAARDRRGGRGGGARREGGARGPGGARAAGGPRRAKAEADFVVERVARLGEICRIGETMLDMLLGQLTLDVGRFRDVLKVPPSLAPPPAPREAAAPAPRGPSAAGGTLRPSRVPTSRERPPPTYSSAQSRRAQMAARDSASGLPGSGACP